MNDEDIKNLVGATLDHIGIAVADPDQAIRLYSNLGLVHSTTEEITEQGVKAYIFPAGQTRIELLSPTRDDSPVAKFLSRKGQGLHHVAFLVEDINKALLTCIENNIKPLYSVPRIGAEGKLIAFLDPRTTGGVLIELTQSVKQESKDF